jgi:fatty acid desaturase
MKVGMEKTSEWKTLAMIGLCYGVWFGAGFLWLTPYWLVGLLLPVAAAFHTSLQHETIHGHPTSLAWLNEVLVSLPLGVIFPYRRYCELHLKHHNDLNLTDPYEDPESYFWPLYQYTTMRPIMRWVFWINNMLAGRIILGPILTIYGFSRTEILRLRAREEGVARAWILHGAGLMIWAAIIIKGFGMPLWVYILFVVYPALSLTSLRSYAEHQAAQNVGARSAIVETNPAMALLYLNNNLHFR